MRTRIPTALFLVTAVLTLPGAGGAQAGQGHGIVPGESAVVDITGGLASTWARVNGNGKVTWVGLTIPLSMVENQPPPGTGPLGAIAVLNYPAVVQQTTTLTTPRFIPSSMAIPPTPRMQTPYAT